MKVSEAIQAKAYAIYENSAAEHKTAESTNAALCIALALLTSQVKDERERGKQMVRNWKHGITNPA